MFPGVGPLLCPGKLLPLEFHKQLGMCGLEGPLVLDPACLLYLKINILRERALCSPGSARR